MKLTPQELDKLFDTLRKNSNIFLRTGQALVNALYNVNPALYQEIILTNNDPFYNDLNIKNFFKFICSEEAYKQLHKTFK